MMNDEIQLDLTAELRKHLIQIGATEDYIGFFMNNKYVIQSFGKPAFLQKVFLGAFFNHEIFMQDVAAPQGIRLALASTGEPLEWLDVTKLVTVPYMVNVGLIPLKQVG